MWFLDHRLRDALSDERPLFSGPFEADESYFDGKRKNMPKKKRAQLEGRGPARKAAVLGIKDGATRQVSAQVVEGTKHATLRGFLLDRIEPRTKTCTDDSGAYTPLPNHESVEHSIIEYVRENCHTNGVVAFWSMLKMAHAENLHEFSHQRLQRYVNEFAGRHNRLKLDTLEQIREIDTQMVRRRLMFRDLTKT